MEQHHPPTVSTAQLRRLLAGDEPPWLVYAPDRASFSDGHVPGSLTASDTQLFAALPSDAAVVLYGEHDATERAKALAADLAATGRQARWYAGGLRAWAAADLPVEKSSEPGAPG